MTPVSAFAGTAHSSAASAPASHILRFMTLHPFAPSDSGRSPPRLASRFLSPAQPFPTRFEKDPRISVHPPTPQIPHGKFQINFVGKTDPSPASEGGTPSQ